MNVQPNVYGCPCCGQGGLTLVRINTLPPVEAVVCSECDRIWVAPAKVGMTHDEVVGDVLPAMGLSPYWENFEIIGRGVPWDRLDVDFQNILA